VYALYLAVTCTPTQDVAVLEAAVRDILRGRPLTLNIINLTHAPAADKLLRAVAAAGRGRYHAVVVDDKGRLRASGDDLHKIRGVMVATVSGLNAVKQKMAAAVVAKLSAKPALAQQQQQALQALQAKQKADDQKKAERTAAAKSKQPGVFDGPPKTTRSQQLRLQHMSTATAALTAGQMAQETSRLQRQQQKTLMAVSSTQAEDSVDKLFSTRDWLVSNGLYARQLQVLKDVAFPTNVPGNMYGRGFRSLVPVPWLDGSVRSVHVDSAQLVCCLFYCPPCKPFRF
jgi:hypothetical protein